VVRSQQQESNRLPLQRPAAVVLSAKRQLRRSRDRGVAAAVGPGLGWNDMEKELSDTLMRVSPRFTHPKRRLRSLIIYGVVLALWIAVVGCAWFAHGVWAWSAGLLYVTYDTWLLFYVAWKTFFVLRSRGGPSTSAPAPRKPEPSVGVLIAAYNEAPALPTTLEALLPQLGDRDVVLLVDDGSDDRTCEVLAERFGVVWPGLLELGRSSSNPALQVWRNRHGGKARALNAGLTRLSTDVVVTVDADTKLAPDAIAALRRAFAADPAMVAACCVIRPVCAPGSLAGLFQWFQTYEYIRAFCSRIAWMRSEALLLVSGAFAGFRREALIAVGGFDPQCLVEDYELIHRLHRYGRDRALDWRVSVISSPRAITDAPADFASFLRQRRRWFAGFLQTQYWNCDMTFNGRYGAVGRWMLPIKAVDTMQPIFGLTAFGLLIAFAVTGRLSILLPVLAVITGKILVDVCFHLWWVNIYGRWTEQRPRRASFGLAFLAAVTEPFSFQLLRHLGAAWGWWSFLSRRQSWGVTASTPVVEAIK
jgi:cellulose synthase/poly-beta-1,6-N-acetylglucosamine synthase-like glycosyltransferase